MFLSVQGQLLHQAASENGEAKPLGRDAVLDDAIEEILADFNGK